MVGTTCGDAPTLNINSIGARNLRKWVGAWAALVSGDLKAGHVITARYNNTDSTFDIIAGQSGVETGTVQDFAGATVPAGYFLCYGQAVSRTTYAVLFAVIGTTYGAGDGSTTFNLPDLRGRVVAGKVDMGGSGAGNLWRRRARRRARVSNPYPNGDRCGQQRRRQYRNGQLRGRHQFWCSGINSGVSDLATSLATYGINIPVTASGTMAAGSSVQPTRIMNKIIKA